MKSRSSTSTNRFKSPKSVALVFNPEKTSGKKEFNRVSSWLKRNEIRVVDQKKISEADAVVSLGGDGTILSVAREAAKAGIPVLGLNLGRLGFMTTTDVKHLSKSLSAWIRGKWTISERMLLEVDAPCFKTSQLALNDAVIRTGSSARVTRVQGAINGLSLGCFIGDGVIISTPTGSTAYSLSAQGPVLHPEMEALILTPICPHSFNHKPIVFPSHQIVDLVLQDNKPQNQVQLCLDGQRVFLLKSGDRVRVKRSPYKLKLVQDPSSPYYRVLREKLSWGG